MIHHVLRVTGGRVAWAKSKSVDLPKRTIERELRALAKEIDLNRTVVHFKKMGYRQTGGYAYPTIPLITNMDGLRRGQWSRLIVVAWNGSDHWISTLAHEGKHVAQFKRGERGSERPAQAFAKWWVKKGRAQYLAPLTKPELTTSGLAASSSLTATRP